MHPTIKSRIGFSSIGETADDSVALLIWSEHGVATVDNVAGAYDFTKDGSPDLNVNPDGAAAGTITESTEATTAGAFVDLINEDSRVSGWHAVLVGAKRADDMTDMVAFSATSALEDGVEVNMDESAGLIKGFTTGPEGDSSLTGSARLSASNIRLRNHQPDDPLIRRVVGAQSRLSYVTGVGGGTAVVTTVTIYSASQTAERELSSFTGADDVVFEKLNTALQDAVSDNGERLLVQAVVSSAPDNFDLSGNGAYGSHNAFDNDCCN